MLTRSRFPALDDPFAAEEPKFVITASNYRQYKDKLSAGVTKLLKTYPESFRVPVYPTHRTVCYPNFVLKNLKPNAKYGELVENGQGVTHVFMARPFPLPKNGLQAVWLTLIGYNGWRIKGRKSNIAVLGTGEILTAKKAVDTYVPYNDPHNSRHDYLAQDVQWYSGFLIRILTPPRKRGTITVGRSFLQLGSHPRMTWQYLPGTRRVRRFPYYGFDTPGGIAGLHGIDDGSVFNGTPVRFNWKIVDVKEMFVPYNAYGLDNPENYETLLGPHGINPEYTRWELHRVRVIVATLKEGSQHWYQKRVFYQDLDTGQFLLGDNYDHHGELWRTTIQYHVWTPLTQSFFMRATVFHDFSANAYAVTRVSNEIAPSHMPKLNFAVPPKSRYTPAAARRMGIR